MELVELPRHRCTEIYCFDASSDEGAFATALARAITLAWDELGVRIELDQPDSTDPALAKDADGQPHGLTGRVTPRPILRGKIVYPGMGPGDPSVC